MMHICGVCVIVILTCLACTPFITYAYADNSTVPDKPTGLTATTVSSNQINLSWTAPSNNGGSAITGYRIEFKIVPDNNYNVLYTTGPNTLSYSHIGVAAGKTYIYRVFALNAIGSSEPSSEAMVSSQTSNSVSDSPTNLFAKAVSSTKINLFWNTPSNNGGPAVTSYRIEEKSGSSSYSVIVSNTGNTNTSYSRTGLTTGTTYSYRVSAINSVGTSNPSNESTATPTSTSSATIPDPPTDIAMTKTSQTKVVLSWSAPINNGGMEITGYKIERKKDTGSFSTLISNTGNATTKYTDNSLASGATYIYRIFAINSIGTSNTSNEISTSQTTNTVPSVPTNLLAKATSSTQIRLSWETPSNYTGPAVTGYKIERKIAAADYSVLVANTGNTSTAYLDTGLKSGRVATYRVSAMNSVGTSIPSNDASAIPKAPEYYVPDSPTNLTAVAISESQINLSWGVPNSDGGLPITGYKISQKVGAGTYFVMIENTGNTKTSYLHTGLQSGTSHTYKVSAINSAGESSQSNEASATTKSTSTTKPISTPAESNGRVNVENSDFALRYTVTGGKVVESSIDPQTFSLSIKLKTTDDGKITVPIPRELIDAKTTENKDDAFYVLVDDKEAHFTEKTKSISRTLTIDFPEDSSEITIYGTHTVPEFPLAGLILVIGIMTILFIRAKNKKIDNNNTSL